MKIISELFESARSPGVIGIVLGLVVLLSFGILSMAVFDPRLNGDNVSALKEQVRDQGLEIFSLEDEIERTKNEVLDQKRNEEVGRKLVIAEKTYKLLEDKKADLEEDIETAKKEIVRFGEEQLAYRDEYRPYERKRAIGEAFEEIELTNGKILKKATIKELQTNKVRFTTEFGSATATWEELPQSWRDRFQIGEGEIEAANLKLEEARKKRNEALVEVRKNRSLELREMELTKSLSRISKSIDAKREEMESARAKAAILRTKAADYRVMEREARQRGNTSSHRNSARKAEAAAEKLSAGIRLSEGKIDELVREKTTIEAELRQLK